MNLQAPRLPLSRGAGPNGLRGDPAAAGQRLPLQGSWRVVPERLSQICDCPMSLTALSFLSQEKR